MLRALHLEHLHPPYPSGEFIIVNKHLLRDLTKLGLWDDDMKNRIISANGSIQNINEIPDNLKALYRTAWEIPQRALIDMSADRGAYIASRSHSTSSWKT